jgi:hypothetical protein
MDEKALATAASTKMNEEINKSVAELINKHFSLSPLFTACPKKILMTAAFMNKRYLP